MSRHYHREPNGLLIDIDLGLQCDGCGILFDGDPPDVVLFGENYRVDLCATCDATMTPEQVDEAIAKSTAIAAEVERQGGA